MKVLRRARVGIAIASCLFSCGQAQHPHSTFAPGDPAFAEASMGSGFSASTVLARVTAAVSHARAANVLVIGPKPACPEGMAHVGGYCMDRYEAYVVELDDRDQEQAHSPYTPVDGLRVRAKVAAGVVPQGYISQVQAASACQNAGKRLCSASEFSLACRGPNRSTSYPYGGTRRVRGKCNEGKGSAVPVVFGIDAPYEKSLMNDPRLNQWSGGLAKTGEYTGSVSPYGIYDLVGNLHEWGAEVAPNGHGAFRGGFYGDAEINGSGCNYETTAHAAAYHDYSTGFRCCQDAANE